jgi:TRAP-type transport system periplasmic protein
MGRPTFLRLRLIELRLIKPYPAPAASYRHKNAFDQGGIATMKPMFSVTAAALAAAALAFAPATQAQPTTLRVYGSFIAADTSSQAMEIFKTEAERLSGGTLALEIIPNTPNVGGAREIIDEVRTRNAFAIWIPASFMSRLVPEIGALGLPFVFDDVDQVARALKGPAGTLIEAKMAAKGFTVLGWMQWGARHIINAKRPLRTLDDFKGLKIRVLPNETHLAIFRALGANPVGLDVKDLYLALRQGDIDGLDNPYSTIVDYKFYEHNNRYLTDTAHVFELIVFFANSKTFLSLQPKEQKAVRDAAAIARARQWEMAAAKEAGSLAVLKEKGVQFDPLPPETRTALRQATAVVIEDARKRFGTKLVDSVLAASKRSAGKGGGHSSQLPLN